MTKQLITLLAVAISANGFGSGNLSIKRAQPLPAYQNSMIWGDGDGWFSEGYGWSDAFRVVDLNRDGRPDLAAMWGPNSFPPTEPMHIGIYLQDAEGKLVRKADYPIDATHVVNLIAADFNGDGVPDLLGNDSGNDLAILLSKGDGTFEQPRWLGLYAFYYPTVADFNGDDKVDIVAGSADGAVFVFLGNGDGTFGSGVELGASIQPEHFAGAFGRGATLAGDINGDGRLDVIVSMPESENTRVGHLEVCFGNGDGTFQPPIRTEGVAAFRGALGDFNGDGIPDYAGDRYGPEQLQIWLGQRDGHFVKGRTLSVSGVEPVDVAAFDLNGDGLLDVAVACEAWLQPGKLAPLAIFLGRGDGTFGARQSYKPGATLNPINRSPQLVDFDRDGRLDLIALSDDGVSDASISNNGLMLGRNVAGLASPSTGFQVTIESSGNSPVIIEKSLDLSSWLPFATNSAPTGSWSIIDPAAPDKQSFYRIRNAP